MNSNSRSQEEIRAELKSVRIELEEAQDKIRAYNGCIKGYECRIQRLSAELDSLGIVIVECPWCEGSGYVPGNVFSSTNACSKCSTRGWLEMKLYKSETKSES